MTATLPPRTGADQSAVSVEHRLGLSGRRNPVAAGRRFVRDRLADAGLPVDVVDLAELLTSEVITNAVLYAPPAVELTVHLDQHRVVVAVADSSDRLPRRRRVEGETEHGYGTLLLDKLTATWGTRVTAAGKRVWFYLPISAALSSA